MYSLFLILGKHFPLSYTRTDYDIEIDDGVDGDFFEMLSQQPTCIYYWVEKSEDAKDFLTYNGIIDYIGPNKDFIGYYYFNNNDELSLYDMDKEIDIPNQVWEDVYNESIVDGRRISEYFEHEGISKSISSHGVVIQLYCNDKFEQLIDFFGGSCDPSLTTNLADLVMGVELLFETKRQAIEFKLKYADILSKTDCIVTKNPPIILPEEDYQKIDDEFNL